MLGDAGKGIAAPLGQIATASIRLDAIHKVRELEFRSLFEKHRQAQGQAAEQTRLERRRNDLLAKERLRQQSAGIEARLRSDLSFVLQLSSRLRQSIAKGDVRSGALRLR